MSVALAQSLDRLGLALGAAQQTQLLAYLDLIQKWNRVYNLTALRSPEEMFSHHLMDSLAAVGPLCRQLGVTLGDAAGALAVLPGGRPLRVLDVGSGAGLPGVVLAICCPGLVVDCVDTVAKKAAFIQQVAAQLQLGKLRGLHDRVERLTGPYDLICSRAFSSLADFASWSGQALAETGVWMAMKAKHPSEEIAVLPADVGVFHVEPLDVPGLDAERCLVWLRKSPATGTATPA
jgi:16S rRNA (guanine527-N7)-methyltransferase